jgi:hypothetical protein
MGPYLWRARLPVANVARMPARTIRDKRYTTLNVAVVDANRFDAEFNRHGLTGASEIATKLGTDRRTVSRIRSGEVQPSIGFWAACRLADIDFDAFVTARPATEVQRAA